MTLTINNLTTMADNTDILFLYSLVFGLTVLIIHLSNKGKLGILLKRFSTSETIIEYLLVLLLVFSFIMYIIHIFNISFSNNNFILNMADNINNTNNTNNTNNQDPVIYWPTGTAQSWGIIGAAIAAYRMSPGSARGRALVAAATVGITVPVTMIMAAIENSNGFHRLMYSFIEYQRTNRWPAENNVPAVVPDAQLKPILSEAERIINSTNTNTNFIGNGNIFDNFNFSIDNILNSLSSWPFSIVLEFFKPIPVEGYIDDLIGLQLFIYILLFIVVISLTILMILFTVINIFLQNKEFILNRFDNKLIKFYIKYQILLGKISIITLPILILFGLLELAFGLHYLITHPIPFDELPVDLHTFIKK